MNGLQLIFRYYPSLSDKQKNRLTSNKATVRVHYTSEIACSAKQHAELALKVVFALLKLPNAIGYLCRSGQFYNPKEKIMPLINQKILKNSTLFFAGVCIQVTQDDSNRMWMHTHGMEQFGIPDIQIKYDDRELKAQYFNLIGNTALYLLDKGPVLKPGHTTELAGDGIIYRIKAVTEDDKKHFGECDVIEIVRDSHQKAAGS